MNKYSISSLLRKIGLIKQADKMRFYINYIRTYPLRRRFFRKNPGVKLPPAYFLYETFNLNYDSFYNGSIKTAQWLVAYFKKYKALNNVNILDWGCGPGRVIRHIPDFVDDSCAFFGTDYNEQYIRWCEINIPGITFRTNQLAPPMDFDNGSMDVIYGISIFTHLSQDMHYAWFHDLMRVLKPGGILLITLQGKVFRKKLTDQEKTQFDAGELVVKANTKEGHRTFAAFHPPTFVHHLMDKDQILEHVPGEEKHGKPQQDVWIIEKRS